MSSVRVRSEPPVKSPWFSRTFSFCALEDRSKKVSLEGVLPVFVPYVFRDVSAKPCVIRACGHFLCSVFVPQGSDLGDIGR